MRYGSVCSGIESTSVAWAQLGWDAAWLSEIEPFPCAVLAHHYPNVPNLGDMTKISRAVLVGDVEAPDILVGGTPCQAYSVAGLREGLNDERGQLTLSYVRLFDAIDYIRSRTGKRPAISCWENVPGVLSDKTNAFGCLLAGLAGEDVELVPPGKKWANAGCVFGPVRTVAWRILDAQYIGVAQRRRRVFVVASARKDFNPVKVLFEFDGVRRDSAPSREAGQDTAGTLASRTGAGGFPGTDEALSGYVQPVASTGDVSHCLNAGGMGRQDFETETLIAQTARTVALRGREGGATAELGDEVATCLRASTGGGDKPHVLAPVIAFDCKASGQNGFGVGEIASTMRSMGHANSHQNGGSHLAVCVTGEITHTLKADGFDASEDGTGRGQPIIAFQTRGSNLDVGEISGTLGTNSGSACGSAPMVAAPSMAVRRLTPIECERLQAFPDGYTFIPTWKGWRKMDASETPESCRAEGLEVKQNKKTGKWRVKDVDGPRYKALGNSMCVNVMSWIGRRIQQEAS
jgi:DNA (cytosine-5)-methyltransferase 1